MHFWFFQLASIQSPLNEEADGRNTIRCSESESVSSSVHVPISEADMQTVLNMGFSERNIRIAANTLSKIIWVL